MTLVLAIPVIGAANPVDPIWLPGLYDDADTDHLVTQTMSPEALIGLAVLWVMACLRSSSTLAGPRAHGRGTVAGGELAARGHPRRAVMSLSAVLRSLPAVRSPPSADRPAVIVVDPMALLMVRRMEKPIEGTGGLNPCQR